MSPRRLSECFFERSYNQPTSTVPAQVVLQSVHDDMAGLKAYAEHPVHVEFGALVKAVSASRQALDYAV